jgi:holliday junction DNA helicase RuvA
MIGHLEGRLRHKSPDFIIVDVNGVGYFVHVPLSTFYDLPDSGQTVSLHIHTHLREDALQLFGFRTFAEKEMFLHLITVNGVGPRLAANILSGLNAETLRYVIVGQDQQRLRSIPGVGKKIAERIFLELRDKLGARAPAAAPVRILQTTSGTYADALSALVNLGYRPAEAEKALHRVQHPDDAEIPLERLLKEALRILA